MRKTDLSKTVTPHYLPKVRESAAAKPHQVNAPNYSRNSHKESYGSNDMVHAYYLEDARKMTQDKTRIPNHRDMASTRAHYTPNACTPKLRNIYRSSPVSKCSGGMSNEVVEESYLAIFQLIFPRTQTSLWHSLPSANSLHTTESAFWNTLLSDAKTGEEAVGRDFHATHARIVSGPDPEPMQEDQTGSNSRKLHVSLAGPNPEHMDDEFLATALLEVP
ncbi:hypothetical protein Tco_1175520 [Tanacetum coccineum]